MTTISDVGFTRTRLDERLAALVSEVKAIFGETINVDPDSIDGQTLGIFAEAVSNLDMLAEAVYHSLNPQSATGAALSRLVQLNGIRRQAGQSSTVTLTLTGTGGTIVPVGSRARTTGNIEFETEVEVVIPSFGTVQVSAHSVDVGPIVAPAGSITGIATPVFGWQTVTNIFDAAVGRLEETDEELRVRRRASVAAPGQAVLDSIYATLANLPGVIQALVLENPENTTDANGLPPHSIYAVVNGGDAQAIADAIWLKKTAGATLVGDQAVVVTDSLGNPHQIKFGRPGAVDIFVSISVKPKPGWPTDGAERIKNAIVAWAITGQQIGEEVIRTRIFEPINSVPGHSVSVLNIGTTYPAAGTLDITVGFDEIAVFEPDNIEVVIL